MSERPIPVSAEDRARQSRVLKALRKASGLNLTPAAAQIGVSASQLSRYESGETILPTPYFQSVARTYGISRADLAERLGLLDDEGWSMADALRGHIPEADILGFIEKWQHESIQNQRAIVRAIIIGFHKFIADVTLKPRAS